MFLLSEFAATGPRPFMPSLRNCSRDRSSYEDADRFIPNRSAMDFDFANYMLTQSRKDKKNAAAASTSKEAYRKLLDEVLLNNRTRILAFNSKPLAPPERASSSHQTKSARRQRHIPQSPERALDASELIDDYYLNLLDWGCSNVLSIALGIQYTCGMLHVVLLLSLSLWMKITVPLQVSAGLLMAATSPSASTLLTSNCGTRALLRTLTGVHQSRVGSLAWNKNILTTGGMDGMIVNNDVRVRSHVVHAYHGHRMEVCGLKWSGSGQQLASGGNDNLLHIWDLSMASSALAPGQNQWRHRFEDHMAAVKALAWCPFQSNLLASGGA
uniref:Uncharacterized protein n=1 Tax=Ananas comosus var. bracteatus TaxID=296719 RepID=A0A6V7NS19_ANACO|nr:unnamed protein product [Ananas comosus var. bracteatus]